MFVSDGASLPHIKSGPYSKWMCLYRWFWAKRRIPRPHSASEHVFKRTYVLLNFTHTRRHKGMERWTVHIYFECICIIRLRSDSTSNDEKKYRTAFSSSGAIIFRWRETKWRRLLLIGHFLKKATSIRSTQPWSWIKLILKQVVWRLT